MESRATTASRLRFIVTVGTLITQGLLLVGFSTSGGLPAGIAALLLTFFAFEWIIIHSPALTRQRRALFDEANILETYQPRARTMGHLFMPEPPTPVCGTEPSAGSPSSASKDAFKAMRDAHYANEYDMVRRVTMETSQNPTAGLPVENNDEDGSVMSLELPPSIVGDDDVESLDGPQNSEGQSSKREKKQKQKP